MCFYANPTFSQASKPPLFTLLGVEETGIDFINRIAENDSMNIISHPNHWNGGGIAIGDLNNDGLADIYLSGNNVPDKLYLNQGNLSFKDISSTSGIDSYRGWKTGVCLVDINKDGFLDIYVSRAGPNSYAPTRSANLLFVNNGDETFSEQAQTWGINDAGLSIQSVFFDMDNDGDNDLFVINNNHELSFGSNIYSKKIDPSGVNHLYRNEGNGHFIEIGKDAGILQENALSLNAVAADVNADGLKDIYVTNDLVTSDHVYINQGNGKFVESGTSMFKHYSSNAMGCDVADFNNDAQPDVLVADMFPENAERQKNQAGITNDYFESMVRQGHHPQYVRNTLSLNNGNGTFSDVAHMAGVAHTDWSWCTLFADFDNDGWKDILITNSLKKNILDNDFRVYKMDSIMRFVSFNAKSVMYKELNKTQSLHLKNYIFKNDGGLIFSQKMNDWGLNLSVNTTSAAYGDLDNDGDLDLVLNNLDTISWIYQNNSDSISSNTFLRFAGGSEFPSVAVLVYSENSVQYQAFTGTRGYQSYPENILHFGLRANQGVDSVIVISANKHVATLYDVTPAQTIGLKQYFQKSKDFKQEFQNDVLRYEFFENISALGVFKYTHKENRYDDFKREPLLYEKHSQAGPHSCKGDINNDGLDDIYVSGSLNTSGFLYVQQSSGLFEVTTQNAFKKDARYEDGGCAFIDLNSDGFLDLYVGSSGYELNPNSELLVDRLYLNDGAGTFKSSGTVLPQFLGNTTCVIAADYNGDGKKDLFVGGGAKPGNYPLSTSSRILKNDKGKLVDVTKSIAPFLTEMGVINAAIWSDYNSDGKPDLLLAGDWMPVAILKNRGKKFEDHTPKTGLNGFSGLWKTICSVDIDNDGDIDYVVGNAGTNTRLQAKPDEPIRTYVADFDGNGTLDPLLTYYIQGQESLIHTRDAVLDQMISLKKKYLSYKEFAKASVEDVVGTEAYKSSLVFEATELNSVILINEGNGQFLINPLPEQAQMFPIRSIITQDLNSDGFVDIILAGNGQDAHFSYGKDQAGQGLVLLSDGAGGFTVLDSNESGLRLDGVITSMELINQNSDNMKLICLDQIQESHVYQVTLNPSK